MLLWEWSRRGIGVFFAFLCWLHPSHYLSDLNRQLDFRGPTSSGYSRQKLSWAHKPSCNPMLSKGFDGFVLSIIVWAITIAVLELLADDGRHSEPGHYSHIGSDKKRFAKILRLSTIRTCGVFIQAGLSFDSRVRC